MNILGIITEYNPYHNGHRLHIQKAKQISQSDYVIAVMSGNFVQRGEPAITDKWTRTKMALLDGVDMVIELPVMYATSSAEFFAHSSVKLLDDTGIVNTLCFGSESGNLNELSKIAYALSNESEDFRLILKKELSTGILYPVARANALSKSINICPNLLLNPNNILGIEYLKTLFKLKSGITPFTITREKADYHCSEINGNIASASAIRKAIEQNNADILYSVIPKSSCETFIDSLQSGNAPHFLNNYSSALNYALRIMDKNEISEILDITEGLENRVINSLDTCYQISDIAGYVKSKRYTYTKIQRALLHTILNIKLSELQYYNVHGYSQYIRILGFKKSSQWLLGHMIKNSKIPVITNLKNAHKQLDYPGISMLKSEIRATNIYNMHSPNAFFRTPNQDYTIPMVIL